MISTAIHFLVGVAVVAGMLWGAAVAARRFGSRGAGTAPSEGNLRIVARRPISKGSSLVRVSVDDRDLLLGASAKGVELLCDLPKTAPAEVASTTSPLPAFGDLVANWRRGGSAPGRLGANRDPLLPSVPAGPPGGFPGILQAATMRRRDRQQARG